MEIDYEYDPQYQELQITHIDTPDTSFARPVELQLQENFRNFQAEFLDLAQSICFLEFIELLVEIAIQLDNESQVFRQRNMDGSFSIIPRENRALRYNFLLEDSNEFNIPNYNPSIVFDAFHKMCVIMYLNLDVFVVLYESDIAHRMVQISKTIFGSSPNGFVNDVHSIITKYVLNVRQTLVEVRDLVTQDTNRVITTPPNSSPSNIISVLDTEGNVIRVTTEDLLQATYTELEDLFDAEIITEVREIGEQNNVTSKTITALSNLPNTRTEKMQTVNTAQIFQPISIETVDEDILSIWGNLLSNLLVSFKMGIHSIPVDEYLKYQDTLIQDTMLATAGSVHDLNKRWQLSVSLLGNGKIVLTMPDRRTYDSYRQYFVKFIDTRPVRSTLYDERRTHYKSYIKKDRVKDFFILLASLLEEDKNTLVFSFSVLYPKVQINADSQLLNIIQHIYPEGYRLVGSHEMMGAKIKEREGSTFALIIQRNKLLRYIITTVETHPQLFLDSAYYTQNIFLLVSESEYSKNLKLYGFYKGLSQLSDQRLVEYEYILDNDHDIVVDKSEVLDDKFIGYIIKKKSRGHSTSTRISLPNPREDIELAAARMHEISILYTSHLILNMGYETGVRIVYMMHKTYRRIATKAGTDITAGGNVKAGGIFDHGNSLVIKFRNYGANWTIVTSVGVGHISGKQRDVVRNVLNYLKLEEVIMEQTTPKKTTVYSRQGLEYYKVKYTVDSRNALEVMYNIILYTVPGNTVKIVYFPKHAQNLSIDYARVYQNVTRAIRIVGCELYAANVFEYVISAIRFGSEVKYFVRFADLNELVKNTSDVVIPKLLHRQLKSIYYIYYKSENQDPTTQDNFQLLDRTKQFYDQTWNLIKELVDSYSDMDESNPIEVNLVAHPNMELLDVILHTETENSNESVKRTRLE